MKKQPNWPRKAIQWTVLTLIILFAVSAKLSDNFTVDFEAYCPFGGLQALGSYLLNNALSCTMTGVQIVMGITLIVATLLLSKLFCSFICPIGTLSEWLGRRGRNLKVQLTIKGAADKGLRSLKYILLFTTLYYTFQSNELFCKKFDPFFGVTSGFNSDVVLAYSISAIVIVLAGSFFIRLFWCKYLCPLGALSNIFKFTGFFALVILSYLLLVRFGIEISYVWPLAAACLGGFLIEVTQLHGKVFPLVKITRNEDSCTSCSLCSKHCHQGIDVANMHIVKDADCNLCGDCVSACPEPHTLQFNKKRNLRYLPHIATVLLVFMGIIIGQLWHIPTINQHWEDFEAYENVKTYSRSGLSSVKCYGSSASFANKMRKVDGVLGVATYVDTKTVKIYYDAATISEEEIGRAIFSPQKQQLQRLKDADTSITEVNVTLENFFDKNDFSYLARFLKDNTDAIGLTSEYGCPVIVRIYFPSSTAPSVEKIKQLLETKSFEYTYNEKDYNVDMGYKVISGPHLSPLDKATYILTMFTPINYQFNTREKYGKEVTKDVLFKSPLNSKNRSRVKYLISHLSHDKGIVGFRSELNSENTEIVRILYVDTLTSIYNINQRLQLDTLLFNYTDGRKGKVPNLFQFETAEVE